MTRPPATTTPEAEVEIDVSLVEGLLAAQHSDLATLSLRPFEHGWDNMMFRLGDDLLVRLPRRRVAAVLIENETRCLPLLAPRLPLTIPSPLRTGLPGEGYPWRWNVLPWIEGEPADRAPIATEEAGAFAAFLEALHHPAPGDAPPNAVRGVPLAERAEAFEERFARLRGGAEVMTPTVEAVWREGLLAPRSGSRVWLHGDLHPRNVLVRDSRIAGVIDWGDVTSGDPASDLASIWLLFEDPGARSHLVERLARDEALLLRARAWAVGFAAIFYETGLNGDARMAEIGRRTFARLEADAR